MNRLIRKKTHYVLKKFRAYWISFTTVIILLCLSFNWYLESFLHQRSLTHNARIISSNLDRFIEDVLQDLYTLPIHNQSKTHCQNTIFPTIQRITLNHPKISGLIISDKNDQLFCSNLPTENIQLPQNRHVRALTGPIQMALFEQPVYLLQQKISDYQLNIVILASVLKELLQVDDKKTDTITLFNELQNKNIATNKHNESHSDWSLSTLSNAIEPSNTINFLAYEKLKSIKGLEVIILEKSKTFLYTLWFYQSLLIFLIILVSYALYYLVRRNFNDHYSFRNVLKQAINNNEFFPVYQPIYDSINHTYSGAEILLRWQDNQSEIILPELFIAEAENSGLIIPITLQIIEMAFQETTTLLKLNPLFMLSFNISVLHFSDKVFFKHFYELIEKYHISPKNIIIEITERDILDKNDLSFINKMTELINLGFSLALDDYGTGHATMSYFHHFPFNYLKIDKIFVQAIGTKAITESLIDTIIMMANNLKLTIIAEGVESKEQYLHLVKEKVQFLQGWYFSRDLTIEQLHELIEGKVNGKIP